MFFAVLFISFLYSKFRNKDYTLIATRIDLPLFIFLIVAAISVFQSRYLGSTPTIIYDAFRNFPWIKGLVGIFFLLAMYAAYYTISNIIRDRNVFKETLFILIMNGVIFSIYGLFGFIYTYITSSNLPSLFDPLVHFTNEGLRIKAVAGEPLFLGGYILAVLPVIYCLLLKKDYFSKRFLMLSSIILTLTLFLTVSRGAWFGFLVFIALFLYWRRSHWMRLYKLAIEVSFFILLVLALVSAADIALDMGVNEKIDAGVIKISEPVVSAFDPSHSRFWSTRVRLWAFEYAWEGFKQHPVLGIGYSDYAFYSGNKLYEGLYPFALNFPEVNNFPLKIISEMGIIGLIAAVWLLVVIIGTMIHRIKQEPKNYLLVGYFLAFMALCAQLLFFSYINYLYIWVMLAMMMSLSGTKKVKIR